MTIKPLTITPDDINDRFHIEVSITPSAQQDEMMRMQIAQAFRAPGADGRPLMSARDIRRFIFHDPHPEETVERAALEALEAADPDIKKLVDAAMRFRWRKDNSDVVRDAEKELNPNPDTEFEKMKKTLTPEIFKQIVDAAKEAGRMEAMGYDPLQMAAQMQQQQQIPASVAPMQGQPQGQPQPGQPLPGQVVGPSPQVLPSQMGGAMTQAPQPMTATPEILAMQARRGRPLP